MLSRVQHSTNDEQERSPIVTSKATAHVGYDKGGYCFVEELGHGGYSIVDKVREQGPNGLLYARKKMRNEDVDEGFFQNEVQNIRASKCVHVVSIRGFYQDDNYSYIVMSPVAEMNLEDWFKRIKDLGPSDLAVERLKAFRWMRCLADTLRAMHYKGVRHRDIKPANILLRGEEVYITDFGLSFGSAESTKLGQTGNIGTYRYRPPESFRDIMREQQTMLGQRTGEKGDVFSLGAVFLDMLNALSESVGAGFPRAYPRVFDSFARSVKTFEFGNSMKQWRAFQKLDVLPKNRFPGLTESLIEYIVENMIACDEKFRHTAKQITISLDRILMENQVELSTCCPPTTEEKPKQKRPSLTDNQRQKVWDAAKVALDCSWQNGKSRLEKEYLPMTARWKDMVTLSKWKNYDGPLVNFSDEPYQRMAEIAGLIYEKFVTMDIPNLVREYEGLPIIDPDPGSKTDRCTLLVRIVEHYGLWFEGLNLFEKRTYLEAAKIPQEWDILGPQLIAWIVLDYETWASVVAFSAELDVSLAL